MAFVGAHPDSKSQLNSFGSVSFPELAKGF
jgi:hypothetical protein